MSVRAQWPAPDRDVGGVGLGHPIAPDDDCATNGPAVPPRNRQARTDRPGITAGSGSSVRGRGATVVLACLGAAAALAVPGASSASPDPSSGRVLRPVWGATGPAPGFGATLGLDSAAGTIVVLTRDRDRFTVDGGDVAGFWLRGPDGLRVGRLPPSLNFEDDDRVRPEVAGPGVVVVPLRTRTNAQTLQRTADGGRTWRRVAVPGCPIPGVVGEDRAYDRRGGGIMTGSGGCVWRTDDAGAHWRVVARDADVIGIAWAGGETYVGVGATGGAAFYGRGPVRRTDDGGRTWTTVPTPPRPAPPGDAARPSTAVGPVTSNGRGRVVVGTDDGAVLDSGDGGRTFARRPVTAAATDGSGNDVHATAVLPGGDVVVGADGRLYPYRDRPGLLGSTGPAPLPAWLRDVAPVVSDGETVVGMHGTDGRQSLRRFANGRTTELAGGQTSAGMGTGTLAAFVRDGVLWTSRDAGRRWTRRRLPPTVRPRAVAADGADDVVLDRTGRLWRAGEGRWDALTRTGRSGTALLTVSAGTPIVGGRAGILRLSGRRLVRTAGPGASVVPVALAADGRRLVAVSYDGRVARSDDGGSRWSRGASVAGYVDGADVAGRTVLIVAGGRARRSTDGGRTFSRGAALPATRASGATNHIGRVTFLDARRAVVAERAHLLVTADGGRTFRPVSLPYAAGALEAVWTPRGVLVQDDVTHDLLRTGPIG